jgi:hypothetical protein
MERKYLQENMEATVGVLFALLYDNHFAQFRTRRRRKNVSYSYYSRIRTVSNLGRILSYFIQGQN